jgi:membrane fusion protein, heavy metal efflux system
MSDSASEQSPPPEPGDPAPAPPQSAPLASAAPGASAGQGGLRTVLAAAGLMVAGVALVLVADSMGLLPGLPAPPETVQAAECAHGLSADCPWCDESLLETRGFCREHGVPEAVCVRCDPRLQPAFEAQFDWCREHGLPESQCERCNPGTLDRWAHLAPAPVAGSLPPGDLSLERAGPRHQRPPAVGCDTADTLVRLASADVARRVGLELAEVVERDLQPVVEGNAVLQLDGNHTAQVTALTAGVIQTVRCDLGQRVEAGQVLALVDAVELGRAKAELLRAQAMVELWERNHAREQRLLEQRVSTERDLVEAETRLMESRISLADARQSLQVLGLPVAEQDAVLAEHDTSSLLPVRAPRAGVIVERAAVVGQAVDPRAPLFTVADLTRLWAVVQLEPDKATRVEPGQEVVFSSQSLPGRSAAGVVTWVSPRVDAHTRTVEVRADVADPERALRANVFGRARVFVGALGARPLVPRAAVQWDGCCNLVFVRRDLTVFEPRKVTLGETYGERYEVIAGLAAGEVVVTTGSFLLRTEVLKDSIGAGCCEAGPE